jgi:hypothetical protein
MYGYTGTLRANSAGMSGVGPTIRPRRAQVSQRVVTGVRAGEPGSDVDRVPAAQPRRRGRGSLTTITLPTLDR